MNEIFDNSFKFKINQDVRHRGDTKAYTADMGLLILKRVMIQTEDDNGEFNYERLYICRMIRFSGSGDMAQFSEKELMSVEEYETKKVSDDIEREARRSDARRVEKEVMEVFQINKEDYVYLKDANGNVDKSKQYRMSGFSINGNDVKITLRESIMTAVKTPDVEREQKEVSSKDQFEKVVKNP